MLAKYLEDLELKLQLATKQVFDVGIEVGSFFMVIIYFSDEDGYIGGQYL